jgi:hypothetical protein
MESFNENVKIYNMIKENVSPDYYARYDIEPISFIMRNNIPYAEGNVIKYVLRHDMKGGKEDIDKAIRYLEMIKEEKYNAKSPEVS